MLCSRLEETTRLCRDQGYVIGSASSGQGREEVVTQAELLGIRPVSREIGLTILDSPKLGEFIHFPAVDGCEGNITTMAEVSAQWVGCFWLVDTVGPREAPEHIVKPMVFQHDDDDMLDRSRRSCRAMAVRLHPMKRKHREGTPNGYSQDDGKGCDEIPSVL